MSSNIGKKAGRSKIFERKKRSEAIAGGKTTVVEIVSAESEADRLEAERRMRERQQVGSQSDVNKFGPDYVFGNFKGYSKAVQDAIDNITIAQPYDTKMKLMEEAYVDLRASAPLVQDCIAFKQRLKFRSRYVPNNEASVIKPASIVQLSSRVKYLLGGVTMSERQSIDCEFRYSITTNLDLVKILKGSTTVIGHDMQYNLLQRSKGKSVVEMDGVSQKKQYIWNQYAAMASNSDMPSGENIQRALGFMRYDVNQGQDHNAVIAAAFRTTRAGTSLYTRFVKGFLYWYVALIHGTVHVDDNDLRHTRVLSYTYDHLQMQLNLDKPSFAFSRESDFPGLALFLGLIQCEFPTGQPPLEGSRIGGLTVPRDGRHGTVYVNLPQNIIDGGDYLAPVNLDANTILRMLVTYAHETQCEQMLEEAYMTATVLLNHAMYANISLPCVESLSEALAPAITTEMQVYLYRADFKLSESLMFGMLFEAMYNASIADIRGLESVANSATREYAALRSSLAKDIVVRTQVYNDIADSMCTDAFRPLAVIDPLRGLDDDHIRSIDDVSPYCYYWALDVLAASPKSVIRSWADGMIRNVPDPTSAQGKMAATTMVTLELFDGTVGSGRHPRVTGPGRHNDLKDDLVEGPSVVQLYSSRVHPDLSWIKKKDKGTRIDLLPENYDADFDASSVGSDDDDASEWSEPDSDVAPEESLDSEDKLAQQTLLSEQMERAAKTRADLFKSRGILSDEQLDRSAKTRAELLKSGGVPRLSPEPLNVEIKDVRDDKLAEGPIALPLGVVEPRSEPKDIPNTGSQPKLYSSAVGSVGVHTSPMRILPPEVVVKGGPVVITAAEKALLQQAAAIKPTHRAEPTTYGTADRGAVVDVKPMLKAFQRKKASSRGHTLVDQMDEFVRNNRQFWPRQIEASTQGLTRDDMKALERACIRSNYVGIGIRSRTWMYRLCRPNRFGNQKGYEDVSCIMHLYGQCSPIVQSHLDKAFSQIGRIVAKNQAFEVVEGFYDGVRPKGMSYADASALVVQLTRFGLDRLFPPNGETDGIDMVRATALKKALDHATPVEQ